MEQEERKAASGQEQDDEISLIDLFAVVWRRERLIIGVTLVAAVAVLVASVVSLVLSPEKSFLPSEFTPGLLC
jgi:uncharacterized protein involved in exopolysaccharide biosynthesis